MTTNRKLRRRWQRKAAEDRRRAQRDRVPRLSAGEIVALVLAALRVVLPYLLAIVAITAIAYGLLALLFRG